MSVSRTIAPRELAPLVLFPVLVVVAVCVPKAAEYCRWVGLERQLHSPDPWTRMSAILDVPEEGVRAERLLIERARTDDNARVRALACLALGRLPRLSSECTAALESALDDADLCVRIGALRALGQRGAEAAAAAPKLVSILLDSRQPDRVREAAAVVLARIGDPSAVSLAPGNPVDGGGHDLAERR